MKLRLHSLYGRISLLHFLLLTASLIAGVWVTIECLSLFWVEVEQRVNHDLASSLARELAPLIRKGPDAPALAERVERINRVHPSLELYLLDEEGRILTAFLNSERVEREHVSLAPILAFLRGEARLPIHGDNPADAEGEKVFSVALVEFEGGARGYLYVILLGRPLEIAFSSLWESYAVRIMLLLLVSTLMAAGFFGAVLFWLLTRRLRRLTLGVQHFIEGHYDHRFGDHSRDEIGQLARTFDGMAATIEVQVQALRQSDEVRQEFVANVSHDLRTPLTSTRAYVERMLRNQEALSPEQRQYLEAVLSNTVLLEHLAGQLGELARLDAGRASPNFEPFSIAELVSDVVLKFRPEAEERGIDLQAHDGQDYPWVHGDIGMMERVLSNLIENALLNTPEGGAVRVVLEKEPGQVRVLVSDNGYGIAPEELPLVTRRFYRIKRSREHADGGSGLGLAIAREVVELHGSTLNIRSEVGKGTTVAFRLPISAPKKPF